MSKSSNKEIRSFSITTQSRVEIAMYRYIVELLHHIKQLIKHQRIKNHFQIRPEHEKAFEADEGCG